MNGLKTDHRTKRRNRWWSAAFLAAVTATSVVPRSSAQTMQKGISVELASTGSAVPVPDADKQDAWIVTVTESGQFYFGIDPVAPDSLAKKLKDSKSHRTLYIKADARAPYAAVVKVLDAAHAARVASVTLLATRSGALEGTVKSPEGIEMKLAGHAPAARK